MKIIDAFFVDSSVIWRNGLELELGNYPKGRQTSVLKSQELQVFFFSYTYPLFRKAETRTSGEMDGSYFPTDPQKQKVILLGPPMPTLPQK